MSGLFGDLFDFNHDGQMDSLERAIEFEAFRELISDDEAEEIEAAGLDLDELSCMDEDERREALEDAGLDPDDYDL